MFKKRLILYKYYELGSASISKNLGYISQEPQIWELQLFWD